VASCPADGRIVAGRQTFARRLGEPLFLEDFGNDHMALAILADGTERGYGVNLVRIERAVP
jgi:hypothetical protein